MILEINALDLQKQYDLAHGQGVKRALDGVSFKIQEGERIGFIGANGAGKTTLLQLLAGIAEPTAGQLDVSGKVTAIFTLGMGLRDDLSGLENIYVEGELIGRTREQTSRIVDAIVEFADLGEFIERPVRTYSTGMKARLAFSTIVHIDPEILIVDEALSVGDARFSDKATRKMRELAARGRILIVVSHSMAAIEEMCTRCIWLEGGKVRMDGTPADVTRAYLDMVRAANDARLSERFQREIVDESLLDGWRVCNLETRTGAGETAAPITGEPAHIAIAIDGPVGAPYAIGFHLRRLDGLVVVETPRGGYAIAGHIPASGTARVTAGFGNLPLNFGVYLAFVKVSANGQPAARRSIVFEVVNPRPHKGGRPILIYPAAINVTRIST